MKSWRELQNEAGESPPETDAEALANFLEVFPDVIDTRTGRHPFESSEAVAS